ncbi:MAG: type I-B CRISPR-associated protein Cas8b1/Cst1, partial [Thermoplasmata archaeon]
DICGVGYYIPNNVISLKNSDLENLNKFRDGIRILNIRLNALLAPSRKFPNSFWNNNATSIVCDLCGYILVHQHLAFTPLSDGSEIFINAPSFKLMWYLNKYSSIFKAKAISEYKEILGMSLIEMASKFYIQLGRWEKMNIEIVSKHGDKIDFFSLPAEIVNLLTNKEIASLLTQIGEFKILNMVLDGKFKDILSFAEKILRIFFKNERTKNEEDFINTNIKLDRNNKNLTEFSQKLFKLYALIEREIKKEVI